MNYFYRLEHKSLTHSVGQWKNVNIGHKFSGIFSPVTQCISVLVLFSALLWLFCLWRCLRNVI